MTDKNNNYCVYIHRNNINNKAYIGITKHGDNPEKRWGKNGCKYDGNKHFYSSIKKYGWDNFEHIIWGDRLSEEDAKRIEKMLIALFNTTNQNYGYNTSPGGGSPSVTDVAIAKRIVSCLETKNQNRIQKSITMFKDRFDNGDENILQCQKCGAYFEKEENKPENNKSRSPGKTKRGRVKRKYCDYCATRRKPLKRVVVCADCGKEFTVDSNNTQTRRCDVCQVEHRKKCKREYMKKRRSKDI